MFRRAALVACTLFVLLFGQAVALAHDVGHLDAGAPAVLDCDTHYLCSQVGGGPVSAPPVAAFDAAAGPAPAFVRQRDASLPARRAYLAQAPPSLSA